MNLENPSGVTALMAACQWNRVDVAIFLLERGADVDSRERRAGLNPLMYSCLSGNSEMVKLLLGKGPRVNATDAMGRNALMLAATLGSSEAVELLLKAGAQIDLRDDAGTTALDWARENGHRHIVELLMGEGQSANAEKPRLEHETAPDLPNKEGRNGA